MLFSEYMEKLNKLSPNQQILVKKVIEVFSSPYIQLNCTENHSLINRNVVVELGDAIRLHHSISLEPFTKDKFEFALEKALLNDKQKAKLQKKGNPGADLVVNGLRISLKTQAERTTKFDEIHISKFMELGKGSWGDNIDDLKGLREQFLHHMMSYDLIFTLRCLSNAFERETNLWKYELVNIPKELLTEAKDGSFRMVPSKQFPKPGYCDVKLPNSSETKFSLYFDGGGERKLQIVHIQKKYCKVLANWSFISTQLN